MVRVQKDAASPSAWQRRPTGNGMLRAFPRPQADGTAEATGIFSGLRPLGTLKRCGSPPDLNSPELVQPGLLGVLGIPGFHSADGQAPG